MENSYQRSHSHEDSQVDAFEYAPSGEEDITVQLREKVRNQALRLRNLEKYRKLCEERISQLAPNHPFPVTIEHLKMNTMPSTYDLHLSKQKINRLEQQISQSQILNDSKINNNGQISSTQANEMISQLNQALIDLQKDKSMLEESLRAEMLASEEQRTYIEVLKQALESKMEHLGISNFTPEEFSDYSQARNHIEKVRVESAKFQNTILDQEAHIKSITQEYKDLENDCKKLITERKETEKQLKDASEALQLAEDELRKLEEEKSALLDFADEKAKKEKELENEINEISEKYEELKEMYENGIRELNEEKEKNEELENEINNITAEGEVNEKSKKEIIQHYEIARGKIDEKDNQIKKLREELRVLASKNEAFQANNSTFSEILKENQNELERVQNELEDLKDSYEKLQSQLSAADSQIKQLKSEKDLQESKYQSLKSEHQSSKELHNKISEESSDEIKSLQIEIQNLQIFKQEMNQKEKINIQKVNEFNSQINHLQEEIELIYKQNLELNEENGNLREEIGILNMKMIQISDEKEIMQSEIMKYQKYSNASQDEAAMLKSRVDELNRALSSSNENCRDKQMKCQNYEYEIQKFSQSLKQYQDELEKEKINKLRALEDLDRKNLKIEELENEFAKINSIIESCFRSSSFKKFSNDISIYSLQQFIKEIEEEKEILNRKLYTTSQELEISSRKLNEISCEQSSNQSKENSFISKISTLYQDNTYLRENLESQAESFQREVKSLHDMIQNLQQENTEFRERIKQSDHEVSQLRRAFDSNNITMRTQEDKISLLNTEKAQLQSLLSRIQRTLGTGELQRIYYELMRVQGDLEIAEREKIRLDSQLLRFGSEENSNLIQKETLKAKIKSCETCIYTFKRKIQNLEEELNVEENDLKNKGKDRSFDIIRTVKKSAIPDSGRTTPARVFRNETSDGKSPYQPRYCESPDRFKSSFYH